MKSEKEYTQTILQAVSKIESFTVGLDKPAFLESSISQSAVIMQLIFIGELAKKISEQTRLKIDLPWQKIIGLRNMATHEYMNLELDQIWDTIKTNIPELKEKLENYQKTLHI